MAANLKDGSGRLDFGAASARFTEIAETIKTRQISEAQGSARSPMPARAPDELWNSRFGCHGFTAAGRAVSANFAPVSHRQEFEPDFSRFRSALAGRPGPDLKVDRAFSGPVVAPNAPLSVRFGQADAPKRSWLARLFRGA